jgi:hypothetical protein
MGKKYDAFEETRTRTFISSRPRQMPTFYQSSGVAHVM